MQFDEDEEDLVELGDVLTSISAQRAEAANAAAVNVLRTQHRTPPHAMDAERAVLGAMMMQVEAIEAVETEGLLEEHFYRPAHARIFAAAMLLRSASEPVDSITVVDQLIKMNAIDQVGGPAAVAELVGIIPTIAHVSSYSRLIKDKAAARRLIKASVDAVSSAFAQEQTASTIVDALRKDLNAIEATGARSSIDLGTAMAEVARRMPALGGTRRVVSFGMASVDRFFSGGVEPGELVVIAARPSMGKTQFVGDITDHLAVNRKERVIFFSLEMDEVSLLTRMAGARAGIDTRRIDLNRGEQRDLYDAMNEIKQSNLLLHCPIRPTMATVQSICRAEAARGPIAGIILDHLAFVADGKVTKGASRDEIVGNHTRDAKSIARVIGCPFFLLSQLNRGVESRPNKRPMMSDLRESGNIEQDADVIAMLYREEYYERDRCADEKRGVAEVIVVKNRNGQTGSVRMAFRGRKPGAPPRFLSMADEE